MLRRKKGSEKFWELARKTAEEVASWPAWKQGKRLSIPSRPEPCRPNGDHEMYWQPSRSKKGRGYSLCRRCGYKPAEVYQTMCEHLDKIRDSYNGYWSPSEGAYLEEMNLVWKELSPDEKDWLERRC